jgi:hypothetical protein
LSLGEDVSVGTLVTLVSCALASAVLVSLRMESQLSIGPNPGMLPALAGAALAVPLLGFMLLAGCAVAAVVLLGVEPLALLARAGCAALYLLFTGKALAGVHVGLDAGAAEAV